MCGRNIPWFIPIRRSARISRRAAAWLKRELSPGMIVRRNQAKVRAFPRGGKIGGFGGNEVTFAVIQENRHELRVEKRSDDKIGELVAIHILRGNLKTPGRADNADRRFAPGAEVKVERISRGRRAVACDPDKSQIGLPVTVKIRDGKLARAKRDGRSDEARDWPIGFPDLREPRPEGYDQAENRASRKKESVGEAAYAHNDDSVYRTLRQGWQSTGMARFAPHEG
jgi:hypothetical protein